MKETGTLDPSPHPKSLQSACQKMEVSKKTLVPDPQSSSEHHEKAVLL